MWVQPVLLRRTKSSTIDGEPVVKLPPREQQLVRKAFSHSEQQFYDEVQAESMQKLKACAHLCLLCNRPTSHIALLGLPRLSHSIASVRGRFQITLCKFFFASVCSIVQVKLQAEYQGWSCCNATVANASVLCFCLRVACFVPVLNSRANRLREQQFDS